MGERWGEGVSVVELNDEDVGGEGGREKSREREAESSQKGENENKADQEA